MFIWQEATVSTLSQEQPGQGEPFLSVQSVGRPVALKRAAVVLSPVEGGIQVSLQNPELDQVEEEAVPDQRHCTFLADDLLPLLHQPRRFLAPALRLSDTRKD